MKIYGVTKHRVCELTDESLPWDRPAFCLNLNPKLGFEPIEMEDNGNEIFMAWGTHNYYGRSTSDLLSSKVWKKMMVVNKKP